MKTGLLFYSADPHKTLWDKIEEAAARYYQKFGVRPNACYVNPAGFPTTAQPANVTLCLFTKPTILPNCVWLGFDESLVNVITTLPANA
jgi:hypothetical protein